MWTWCDDGLYIWCDGLHILCDVRLYSLCDRWCEVRLYTWCDGIVYGVMGYDGELCIWCNGLWNIMKVMCVLILSFLDIFKLINHSVVETYVFTIIIF
jgi:hypothetical protein